MTCSRDRTWPEIVMKIRCYGVSLVWILFGLWISLNIFLAHKRSTSMFDSFNGMDRNSLIRNKRFIFMDNQRRLSLPTGSILALSNVVSLPFLGNLPVGYGSGLTIAVPLTVKFDDLGMTSPDNRFGYFDFMNFTNMMGMPQLNLSALRLPSVLAPTQFPNRLQENIPNVLVRPKRSMWKNYPGVNYAGGDREMIYQIVEDFISSFGIDGQGCVIRAICEIHEEPLFNYGFFGEALHVLLSPSLSAFAEYRLGPYLKAEKQGKEKKECNKYHKQCKYSMFSPKSLYQREHPLGQNFTDFDIEQQFNNFSDLTSNSIHHRQKRFFMFGPARRLLFPPSTAVVGTPTLNLPFLRDLPDGFKSQLSYSIPFTFSFDDLGLTSSLNAFGNIPLLSLFGKKRKREAEHTFDGINYAGGDREMMYAVIADSLNKIGLNGEACILRVICESHELPLVNHGLFGEFFHLFLTPSLAPKATERLAGFVKAEKLGKNCGDCGVYFKQCPQSLFTNPQAGIKFSNETELSECKRRHAMEYREETMDLIQSFKSKYKKVKKPPHRSSQFVQEIASGENKKLLFKNV